MSQKEFETYLRMLARMLGLTAAQREVIAQELRDHLESRMDELIDEGQTREAAIETALEEFGEASDLARQFRFVAHHKLRRRIMRTSLGLSSVAALILAVAYLLPEQRPMVPEQSIVVAEKREADEEPGAKIDAAMERRADFLLDDAPLRQVITYFENVSGLNFVVAWERLAEAGIGQDFPVNIGLKDMPAEKALALVLKQVSARAEEPLAIDVDEDFILVSTQSDLQAQLEVRHYDIGYLLGGAPHESGHGREERNIEIHIERKSYGRSTNPLNNDVQHDAQADERAREAAIAAIDQEIEALIARNGDLVMKERSKIARLRTQAERMKYDAAVARQRETVEMERELETMPEDKREQLRKDWLAALALRGKEVLHEIVELNQEINGHEAALHRHHAEHDRALEALKSRKQEIKEGAALPGEGFYGDPHAEERASIEQDLRRVTDTSERMIQEKEREIERIELGAARMAQEAELQVERLRSLLERQMEDAPEDARQATLEQGMKSWRDYQTKIRQRADKMMENAQREINEIRERSASQLHELQSAAERLKDVRLRSPLFFQAEDDAKEARTVQGVFVPNQAATRTDPQAVARQIINLLMETTGVAYWSKYGGPGTISEFNGTLIVKTHAENHELIEEILDTLHDALIEQTARAMRNEHVMRLMGRINELRYAGEYHEALEIVEEAELIAPDHPMLEAVREVLEETIERMEEHERYEEEKEEEDEEEHEDVFGEVKTEVELEPFSGR